MQNRIVRPTRVDVRRLWPGEATDFTPWLAENLEWLEVLDMGPLELVKVEALLPGISRSLDILAETADGRRVAIENQYAATDHDHLTRGLAYAVGHQAEALVIISESHRPEFIAVADYLNAAAEALGHEDGIAVFLVGLAVDQVGEHFVPRFEVLSRPNEWITETRQTEQGFLGSVPAFLTATDEEHRDSWRTILDEWQQRDGATISTRAKQSVALYLRDPASGNRPRNVLALTTNGNVTIMRGYLVDSGLYEGAVEELDALIQDLFPNARWPEKQYYLTDHATAPATIAQFADAVQRHIDSTADRSVRSHEGRYEAM